MTDPFTQPPGYPESVLLSIYNAYPRKTGRPQAIKRIREALDRICQGEIDGQSRTQAEAIEFLRMKTEEARQQLGAREKKFIPHMATFLHQRRYLRPDVATIKKPKRFYVCIVILSQYPNMPDQRKILDEPEPFMMALAAIDKSLAHMERTSGQGAIHCQRRLASRTQLYAMAVKEWPVEDLKFIPNPVKWYSEGRYEQPEASWSRQPNHGFGEEREQLKRILQ